VKIFTDNRKKIASSAFYFTETPIIFAKKICNFTKNPVLSFNFVKYFTIIFFLITNLHFQVFSQEKPAVPVWRAALSGKMMGNPVSQVESVAVLLDSGNLCCYSSQGNFLWNYFAGGKLGPYISRSREGTSYISRTNGIFIAINRSGREIWRKDLGETLAAPAIIGWDGRIFVPTSKKLFCYTAAGSLLWSQSFDRSLVFGPIADLQGGIILGTDGGIIHHINHFGEIQRFEQAENPAFVVPVLVDAANTSEEMAEFRKTDEKVSSQPQLFLIAADKTGKLSVLGENHLGEENVRPPLPALPSRPLQAVSRSGNIVFTLQNSQVVLMSFQDRSIVWTAQSQNVSSSSTETLNMIYDERGIYVVSQNGASGFTEDGRRLWIINIQGTAAMTAFSDEGLLYSGGNNWILYAYRLEDRIRRIKQSVYGPAPEGSYEMGNPGSSSWDGYPYRYEEVQINRTLKTIEEKIQTGTVGNNEKEYTAYLMDLASNAVSSFRRGTTPTVQITHRARALQLLAFIGSRETIPFLARIFDQDPEIVVQAAAAETIGKIGVDPDGIALKAFNMKIYSPAAQRNEQVLLAVTKAAASLCRFSGTILSGESIKLLGILATQTMPLLVRNQAKKELATLR
jgi:outer membrane protein assembly factor BamB